MYTLRENYLCTTQVLTIALDKGNQEAMISQVAEDAVPNIEMRPDF